MPQAKVLDLAPRSTKNAAFLGYNPCTKKSTFLHTVSTFLRQRKLYRYINCFLFKIQGKRSFPMNAFCPSFSGKREWSLRQRLKVLLVFCLVLLFRFSNPCHQMKHRCSYIFSFKKHTVDFFRNRHRNPIFFCHITSRSHRIHTLNHHLHLIQGFL